MKLGNVHISSFQIIIFGFAAIILLGALLLMLPWASVDPGSASFSDALFTSTSAVCVTGLVVRDTATYWTTFGETVILLLIQIGGMGVVTIALAISLVSGRHINLVQRNLMKESISAPNVGGIVRMTNFILKGVLFFEFWGAVLLSFVFIPEFGLARGLWYSLFHSISAFCNAGFDLMGIQSPYSSLTNFADNPIINLTICSLIIIGGIGFFIWEDIKKNKLHLHHYRLQSKIVLTTTALLITIPFFYYYLNEYQALVPGKRFFAALFQTVTTRTAGFNTYDFAKMSENGKILAILLMLVGGSPGSTAGGMKTTTLAVLVCTAFSVFGRNPSTSIFHRRVEDSVIRIASSILLLYLVLFLAGAMAISGLEGIPLITCLFETASAIGTVGLTLGITPSLGLLSRAILIGLMYFGRVGGLTIIFAALPGKHVSAKYPTERITVG